MKYVYAYKTSDGVRHEDSMDAASREEVFAALRARGIKAIKVVAADGTKANGEVRGVRKRVVALSVVATAMVVGAAMYALSIGNGGRAVRPAAAGGTAAATVRNARPLARQTINGDRRRIAAAAAAFTNAAERFMAAFAEPGRPIPDFRGKRPADEEFISATNSPIGVADNDFTEAADLKRIVARIKNDLRAYLSDGGTVAGYVDELVRRQKLEISYRDKAERKLARMTSPEALGKRGKSEAYEYWLKANAQLNSMGIYPLPLPDALRDYEAVLDIDEY